MHINQKIIKSISIILALIFIGIIGISNVNYINHDGSLYIYLAENINKFSLKEILSIYNWPIYSFFIYIVQFITNLSFIVSGKLLNFICAIFLLIFIYKIIELETDYDKNNLFLAVTVPALFFVSSKPLLNNYYLMITRDYPFWTFLVMSYYYLLLYVKYFDNNKLTLSIIFAFISFLFRVEAVAIFILYFFLYFKLKIKLTTNQYKFVFCLILFFIFFIGISFYYDLKFKELFYIFNKNYIDRNPDSINSIFNNKLNFYNYLLVPFYCIYSLFKLSPIVFIMGFIPYKFVGKESLILKINLILIIILYLFVLCNFISNHVFTPRYMVPIHILLIINSIIFCFNYMKTNIKLYFLYSLLFILGLFNLSHIRHPFFSDFFNEISENVNLDSKKVAYNFKELYTFDQISKKQLILHNRQSSINERIMLGISEGNFDFFIINSFDFPPYFVAQCPESIAKQNKDISNLVCRFGKDIVGVDFDKITKNDVYLDHYKFRNKFTKKKYNVYVLEKK